MNNKMEVRINGVVTTDVMIQRIVLSQAWSRPYVEYNDPLLGALRLDDNFLIEVRDGDDFREINATQLIDLLDPEEQ
jgi:hypothetical protein